MVQLKKFHLITSSYVKFVEHSISSSKRENKIQMNKLLSK